MKLKLSLLTTLACVFIFLVALQFTKTSFSLQQIKNVIINPPTKIYLSNNSPTKVPEKRVALLIDHTILIEDIIDRNLQAETDWETSPGELTFNYPSDWEVFGENYFLAIFKNGKSSKTFNIYFYTKNKPFADFVLSREKQNGTQFILNGLSGLALKKVFYLEKNNQIISVRLGITLSGDEIDNPEKYSELETAKKIISSMH